MANLKHFPIYRVGNAGLCVLATSHFMATWLLVKLVCARFVFSGWLRTTECSIGLKKKKKQLQIMFAKEKEKKKKELWKANTKRAELSQLGPY